MEDVRVASVLANIITKLTLEVLNHLTGLAATFLYFTQKLIEKDWRAFLNIFFLLVQISAPVWAPGRKASRVGITRELVFIHYLVDRSKDGGIVRTRVSGKGCIEILEYTMPPIIVETRLKRRNEIDRNGNWKVISIKEIILSLKRGMGIKDRWA